MNKEQLNALMATASVQLAGKYHDIYELMGARRGNRSQNYHCFEECHHEGGIDDKPSMGINNDTGQYNCFACDVKGNLYTYWEKYSPGGSSQYHDFLIKELNVEFFDANSKEDVSDVEHKKATSLVGKFENGPMKSKTINKKEEAPKDKPVPKAELDKLTNNLLHNAPALRYLYENRNINKEMVKKYGIGLTNPVKGKQSAFIFPVISPDGVITNLKIYNPLTKNIDKKWRYAHTKRKSFPIPIQNFAADTIMFFEGEPDAFCAVGFGFKGALTLGSAANSNPATILGGELTERYLSGKEVVICADSDKAGRDAAAKLAANLYTYARQIKIIDFDKSEHNPYGLDPALTRDKDVRGKTKTVRIEKDFTDFMKKNGFDDVAKERFQELIKNTQAYTDSRDRSSVDVYKVTVAESRLPKYHTEYDGPTKRIQVVASVSDLDSAAYMFYDKIPVECPFMNSTDAPKKCVHCSLPTACGPKDQVVEFNLHLDMPKENIGNIKHIGIVEKDILEMIEVNEKGRLYKIKSLCGINTSCNQVRIKNGRSLKVMHAKLMSDANIHAKSDEALDSNIDVDAYILGADVQVGRSYKFEGVQTTTPDGQYAAIFVDSVEPVLTSVESFEMSDDMDRELRVFKVKEGETVSSHLERRYKEFSDEAKVTDRNELFLMYDLAFFSSTSFNNSLISDSIRKWVEVGVVGESRCGKSMVAEYLIDKYRTGEYFSCSSSISRSGVLGGIAKQFNGKNKISWGVMPKNDKGMVVIDEVASMTVALLSDMTPSRSNGIVNVEMTISGKARARTRKIFVSNPRDKKNVDGQPFEGMAAIRDVYSRDEIIQRFDLMYYVKSRDVDKKDFQFNYEPATNDFSDLQSRHLIMWAYSRKFDDYIWEGGVSEFNRYVNEQVERLYEVFHDKTLLVSQESSVRVIRLAVSLATLLYSTPSNDYNKVFVKREHVDHIIDFTLDLYTRKNMRLDEYSEQIRASETLGKMEFMENIIKFVSVESIIRETNFSEKSIQQVFFDYLQRVSDKSMWMVDASSDVRKMTGIQTFNAVHKLVQTLVARNCLIRSGTKFEKTPMFTSWLDEKRGVNPDELSNILEYESNPEEVEQGKQALSLTAKFEARQ